MDPKEVNTPEGEMRFLMLREMFRAVALQSGWIHTVSNWALGTTGAYMGLLVANLDKIQPHLAKGWTNSSGFIQFSTGVEKSNPHLRLATDQKPSTVRSCSVSWRYG